jgi:hypothetical protein
MSLCFVGIAIWAFRFAGKPTDASVRAEDENVFSVSKGIVHKGRSKDEGAEIFDLNKDNDVH